MHARPGTHQLPHAHGARHTIRVGCMQRLLQPGQLRLKARHQGTQAWQHLPQLARPRAQPRLLRLPARARSRCSRTLVLAYCLCMQ